MTEEQTQYRDGAERALDSLEEHFWLLEKVTARGHLLTVRLKGTASEEQWCEAFRQVQSRYAMLRTSIGKLPGERPFLYHVPDRPLPIEFTELTDATSLESFAETELLRSFGAGENSLTRVTIFRGDQQTAVVLTSHHSAMDGKAHLSILQDVLAVLEGKQFEPCPGSLPPSTSSRFGRTTPPYSSRSPLNDGDPEMQSLHAVPPIRIVRLAVEMKTLESILRACRSREVSLHCALLTSLARAGFRFNAEWSADGIRALTPINVRANFGLDNAVGMSMVLHRAVFQHGEPFWEAATNLNRSLRPSELSQVADNFFNLAEELVAEEHSPTSHLARIAGTGFVHDMMLTNYGVLDWKGTDQLQVEDLFTAGVAGHLETQKVAAVTRDETLFLTLVSQAPIPHFLETAVEELVAACSQ
jgi:hypothetical protein